MAAIARTRGGGGEGEGVVSGRGKDMLGGQFAAAAGDNHSAITRRSSDLHAEPRH